ncbi:MAG: hypothetical protein IT518_05455, partial [Burkholderiales bacterium]|nr:hypothetical protein [Burkholderiales bacterium]
MTVRSGEVAALAAAIEEVRRFATPADTGLSAFFRAHRELGARDRAFVADAVFAYLRRKRSLEALAGIDPHDPRRLALAVLVREMGRSLRDLAPALNAADDVWLRAFKSRMHGPPKGRPEAVAPWGEAARSAASGGYFHPLPPAAA